MKMPNECTHVQGTARVVEDHVGDACWKCVGSLLSQWSVEPSIGREWKQRGQTKQGVRQECGLFGFPPNTLRTLWSELTTHRRMRVPYQHMHTHTCTSRCSTRKRFNSVLYIYYVYTVWSKRNYILLTTFCDMRHTRDSP